MGGASDRRNPNTPETDDPGMEDPISRARELRRDLAPAEQVLWKRLRRRQLFGYHFRCQHPIGPFIVDFACTQARLAVEVDGDSHGERRAYDAVRTRYLEREGYRVLRFTNREVSFELDAVLEAIAVALGTEMG